MPEAFFNRPSGKWVVRTGSALPVHLGGSPDDRFNPIDPPRLLTDADGRVRLFDTEAAALEAALKN